MLFHRLAWAEEQLVDMHANGRRLKNMNERSVFDSDEVCCYHYYCRLLSSFPFGPNYIYQCQLQAFHMNCQRHILDVKWYDFVTNESICTTTGLADIRDIVRRRRLGLFGHVARFDRDVPAANALSVCCDSKDTTPPNSTWRRSRGRPRHSWLRQICKDTLTCRPLMLLYWHRTEIRGERSLRPPG